MKGFTLTQETYYSFSGKGEPVIFIHGVGLDHTMWHSQMNDFSANYAVYAIDMLGHGESRKLRGNNDTLNDFSEQLFNVYTELELKSAHLVGFSMGAMVAQLFSLHHPDKVKTLTIANAVANRTHQESEAIQERVKVVEKSGKNTTIDAAIKRWFTKAFLKTNAETVMKVKERLENNDELSYLNAYRIFATADKQLWGRLGDIKQPTFIITGEGDIGSSPRMARQMHEKIPNSEVCIVEQARHMLPVERPEVFNKAVQEFLIRTKRGE